jgi:hypothetical protein
MRIFIRSGTLLTTIWGIGVVGSARLDLSKKQFSTCEK